MHIKKFGHIGLTQAPFMPAFIETLRYEIDRLKSERLGLAERRTELVGTLDVRIAEIDERLRAAERMLTAYTGTYTEEDVFGRAGETVARGSDYTWANVETVPIPSRFKKHRLDRNSKKAKIIRATMAFLQKNGPAKRDEILQMLYNLDIMTNEKNPKGYLSVILSRAREIFATNGTEWRLRQPNETHTLGDEPQNNSTTFEI